MLEDIIAFLPPSRQILLYSATFPLSVKEFKVSGSMSSRIITSLIQTFFTAILYLNLYGFFSFLRYNTSLCGK